VRARAFQCELCELPGAEMMQQLNPFPLIAMLVIVLILLFWLL
jgi:hypothetical protein